MIYKIQYTPRYELATITVEEVNYLAFRLIED